MRGLEFRGTYCQQREVEAISEGLCASKHQEIIFDFLFRIFHYPRCWRE